MNSGLGQKNRPYQARMVVQNIEASSSILSGQPVCMPMNLTNDGHGVVLPSTAGAAIANTLSVGIASVADGTAEAGSYLDVITLGFCPFTRLVRGTRAATTDAWPTFPALAIGDILSINTVANAVAYSTTGAAYQAGGAVVFAGLHGQTASSALVAASTATQASSAYSAFSGQTAYTVGCRTWLKLM
jgi:hypothetical protein